jgi:hypothetical protein
VWPPKGYGPKWHTLASLGCHISILRVRGPSWHIVTSVRTTGVFNSLVFKFYKNHLLKNKQTKNVAKRHKTIVVVSWIISQIYVQRNDIKR